MSSLEVDVIGGGDPGPEGRAAITVAVRRTLGARGPERGVRTSAWALAGRREARGGARIRSRAQLLEPGGR